MGRWGNGRQREVDSLALFVFLKDLGCSGIASNCLEIESTGERGY